METTTYWRKCSVCKRELKFSQIYFVCSVSSCNLKRAPNQFCSVTCWDTHNAVLLHRNAGADEQRAPSHSEAAQEGAAPEGKRRIIVASKSAASESGEESHEGSEDILVVVSKLKAYIKSRADMNVSADVMPLLSEFLRRTCDEAIQSARQAERKTVMARDFRP